MHVKIQYSQLANAINFLENIPLKGLQSINRTRFKNLLQERLKQVAVEEVELIKEHTGVDEKGDAKRTKEGHFDIKDVPAFKKVQEEYFAQHYIVDGGDSLVMLQSFKKSLEDYDGEIAGKEATAYEHLYTAFEEVAENKAEKGEGEHDGNIEN
ncbi:hypothetical protein [Planomicrobium okeanokoites]|uniref:hypothetical protein n=1 Tax=Planomicrobium okeanokoites TaxID=244 RepID=UPI000A04F05E|nr:hypothetical protein [Planomicrobium okeanokoites]